MSFYCDWQDVASKSLSGLESLVDQIPNMNEGEHVLHMHHHNQTASNNFNHYPSAQPSFSYPSTSFGHYTPHYSAPSGGGGNAPHSFPPSHSYNQGKFRWVQQLCGKLNFFFLLSQVHRIRLPLWNQVSTVLPVLVVLVLTLTRCRVLQACSVPTQIHLKWMVDWRVWVIVCLGSRTRMVSILQVPQDFLTPQRRA